MWWRLNSEEFADKCMCSRLNSEGVRKFQPRVFTLGTKRKARGNAESVGETRSRSSSTLSAFADFLDGLTQGVATLDPGLALVNAFGVQSNASAFSQALRRSVKRFGVQFSASAFSLALRRSSPGTSRPLHLYLVREPGIKRQPHIVRCGSGAARRDAVWTTKRPGNLRIARAQIIAIGMVVRTRCCPRRYSRCAITAS